MRLCRPWPYVIYFLLLCNDIIFVLKVSLTDELSPFRGSSKHPRASEAGSMPGSDIPTIYVRDIDMYIPLEKPNTEPRKLYATRTEMLGKAI